MAIQFNPPLQPGIYHVEVSRCEEGYSASEDPKLTVKFVALDHKKETLCQDTIMCGGAGRGMGLGKLGRLGMDTEPLKRGGSVSGPSLVGKRCYVNVVSEIYNGRNGPIEQLKVKGVEGNGLGYWSDDAPPEAYTKAKAKADEDIGDPLDDGSDVPF